MRIINYINDNHYEPLAVPENRDAYAIIEKIRRALQLKSLAIARHKPMASHESERIFSRITKCPYLDSTQEQMQLNYALDLSRVDSSKPSTIRPDSFNSADIALTHEPPKDEELSSDNERGSDYESPEP
jgi:hypothetical protein